MKLLKQFVPFNSYTFQLEFTYLMLWITVENTTFNCTLIGYGNTLDDTEVLRHTYRILDVEIPRTYMRNNTQFSSLVTSSTWRDKILPKYCWDH